MLEIKPIQSKAEQETACTRCAIPYDPDCMAYACLDDGAFIGMAQFNIESGAGLLRQVTTIPGHHDFEALFLMGRAVLNFMDLCGVHKARSEDRAAEERVLLAIGFKRGENGQLWADMTHMFGGCEHKDQAPPSFITK